MSSLRRRLAHEAEFQSPSSRVCQSQGLYLLAKLMNVNKRRFVSDCAEKEESHVLCSLTFSGTRLAAQSPKVECRPFCCSAETGKAPVGLQCFAGVWALPTASVSTPASTNEGGDPLPTPYNVAADDVHNREPRSWKYGSNDLLRTSPSRLLRLCGRRRPRSKTLDISISLGEITWTNKDIMGRGQFGRFW